MSCSVGTFFLCGHVRRVLRCVAAGAGVLLIVNISFFVVCLCFFSYVLVGPSYFDNMNKSIHAQTVVPPLNMGVFKRGRLGHCLHFRCACSQGRLLPCANKTRDLIGQHVENIVVANRPIPRLTTVMACVAIVASASRCWPTDAKRYCCNIKKLTSFLFWLFLCTAET